MLEVTDEDARAPNRIRFKLVDSQMFAAFDGEWRVQAYSRTRSRTDPSKFDYKSKLSYVVSITPKGLVPVPALEWRIREDVPINLKAVKLASEKRVKKAS
uniref:Coenzyme Q-binding protein COQ10 START domain-containing protein n=1 Tax=Haptolina brevifila TaxID=156173 RepID=A0A7S2FCT2_9EUKA|mmetsp:Transcript_10116/g.20587  ORF Transcript_10116/g.20587 Transcript_10116/m.20587 type:complete len:100 (+) Transcript_10116:2-301(+)